MRCFQDISTDTLLNIYVEFVQSQISSGNVNLAVFNRYTLE